MKKPKKNLLLRLGGAGPEEFLRSALVAKNFKTAFTAAAVVLSYIVARVGARAPERMQQEAFCAKTQGAATCTLPLTYTLTYVFSYLLTCFLT